MHPPPGQRIPQVIEALCARVERDEDLAREILQRLPIAGRQRKDARALLHRRLLRREPGLPVLQDRVGIGATVAKRVDADEAAASLNRKRFRYQRNPDAHRLQRNGRIGLPEVEMRRNHAMPEHQRHLGEARHPGCTFEVTDVGLHRGHDAL